MLTVAVLATGPLNDSEVCSLLFWTTAAPLLYQEEAPPAKEAESAETSTGKADWWTGSDYNGRKYPTPKV